MDELHDAANAVGRSLWESKLFGDSAVSPDIRTQTITVRVAAKPGTKEQGLVELARVQSQSILAELGESSPDLVFGEVEYEDPARTLEFGYGGEKLVKNLSSTATCTTAFTVKRGSLRGILTAGHCTFDLEQGGGNPSTVPGIADYRHSFSSVVHPVVALPDPGIEDHRGDMHWFTTHATEKHKFYSLPYQLRVQTGFRHLILMDEGDLTCNFGRRSFNFTPRCGYIDETNVSKGQYGHLVVMDREVHTEPAPGLVTVQGDSGGPWYTGGTAYGIHHGNAGSTLRPGCPKCDVYTPVSQALSVWNLTLITSP